MLDKRCCSRYSAKFSKKHWGNAKSKVSIYKVGGVGSQREIHTHSITAQLIFEWPLGTLEHLSNLVTT